jgi:hypothetical protein
MKTNRIILSLWACTAFSLAGCMSVAPRPNHSENVCHVFREYPSWYNSARKTEKRWGVPVSVQMAIIYHESAFDAEARPEREKLLWIIPWKRPTSAYGFSQAVDGTWAHYKQNNYRPFAQRNRFADASDFIGWYSNQIHHELGVPLSDAQHLYLAYHEGINGYRRGSQWGKRWLLSYANRVQRRANAYQMQLDSCSPVPKKKRKWKFW